MAGDEARLASAGGGGTGRDAGAPRLDGSAFVLNRLIGLALVAYLYLHLLVLSLLARGPNAWDDFVEIASSPPFLVLDLLLLAGVLIHGLNGIRLGLVGLGFTASHRRALALSIVVIAATVALFPALRIVAGG